MSESNKWMLIASLVVISILLYLLAPVLTPFFIAAVLAYISDPLVDKLEARKFPRTLAVVTVFCSLTLLAIIGILILVPMIERQIDVFAQKLPAYINLIQHNLLPKVLQAFGLDETASLKFDLKSSLQSYWGTAGGFTQSALASVTRSGLAFAALLANLLLIPVVTFYLLRDWDHLVARINELIPRRSQPVVARLAMESDEVLGSFLRGQLMVMMALAAIYAVGLSFVGLDLAVLIGLSAGMISFVPYLGFIVGILFAGIASIVQYQDLIHLAYIGIVFGIGQAIEGMVLTPLLVGDRIGLHPVAVIFAVLAGGQLFGFVGILLALPVAAVIAVMLRYAHERYLESGLYGKQ